MNYYLVSIVGSVGAFADTLTYRSTQNLPIGIIVKVPTGRKQSMGVVIARVDMPNFECKDIDCIVINRPLPPHIIATQKWLTEYYAAKSGVVWQTILPGRIGIKPRTKIIQSSAVKRTKLVLNKAQSTAVDEIRKISSGNILLHGITGSGKTEIYKTIAQDAIDNGQSVILLVPEISLTAQLVNEFTSRFNNVVVTHSAMTDSQRNAAWRHVLIADQPQIIIGPRSALFMPVHNLGLVIIDECHESTYKQDMSPRYHAVLTASKMMQIANGRLLLGSATPSINDYYLAKKFNRPIITINQLARNDAVKPSTEIVDLTKRDNFRSDSRIFSIKLLNAMRQALDKNRQILLFHNRRGTAGIAMCDNCGWIVECPICHVPLTLHHDRYKLICHICGYQQQPPTTCPDCDEPAISYKGIGTKRIEEEARKLFPLAKIARFDGDTEKGSNVHDLYDSLKNGDIDIIIGTQTIAKGLDLPKLAVAGIVQADAGLSMPDFSSNEKTFQLIAQACGRVGRNNQQTTAIIQTYRPDHPAVRYGASQDYRAFYESEIAERQRGHFPPFTYLLRISCTYKTENGAIRAINQLARHIKQNHADKVRLLGPTPAFYERMRGNYRWQVTVRTPHRQSLLDIINNMPDGKWQIDIDPVSLL